MPLPMFLVFLMFVISMAGMTIALAFFVNMPFAALGFAALSGSVILILRQWT